MKIINMVKNKHSVYSKFASLSNKKYKQPMLTSLVALGIAVIASLFNNPVLACIFSVISLIIAGAEVIFKLVKGTKEAKLDTVLIVVAIIIPFCMAKFAIAALGM